MLLKSIELYNFRQFVDEKIDFSTDSEKNVTLIIGDNGTGKTTFAQAFFWCLYGTTDFKDKIMLNRVAMKKLTPDKVATVKVVLRLTHGSADYEITRTQDYKKSYSDKISSTNTAINMSRKTADGNTTFLKPLECETEIKMILPKELSTYFFFDGERIEKMSKDISSGKKSGDFAEAVIGLTGLKGMLAALNHLSPSKTPSVYRAFSRDYKEDSAGKISSLTSQIEAIQMELESIETRLDEAIQTEESARVVLEQAKEDIKQYADGEKLQTQREMFERELFSLAELKRQAIISACKTFNNGLLPFVSISLVKDALEILSHSDFSGKDIPEMHAKTIEYLLKRKVCICGTCLEEGTLPYKKAAELMDYLPPQSIGVTVGQFIKDTKRTYSKSLQLQTELGDVLSLIGSYDDKIEDAERELTLIAKSLDGENIREKVRKLNAQISSCQQTIKQQDQVKRTLLKNQGSFESEKAQKENSRSELSLLDNNNLQVELYMAYAKKIHEELLDEYSQRELEVRQKLQSSINEIFKFIYDGGLSLSIDEKYNITVHVEDYDGGVETSTAQSISVIFAFISAIIKMAKENQSESGDQSYSEPYPLVMDAPLSAFDKRRIEAICTSLPSVAEQVIIFIKDTDGELAESHLGEKVMTRHHFEKLDEFHTKLI